MHYLHFDYLSLSTALTFTGTNFNRGRFYLKLLTQGRERSKLIHKQTLNQHLGFAQEVEQLSVTERLLVQSPAPPN